jgi:hypothetical protein
MPSTVRGDTHMRRICAAAIAALIWTSAAALAAPHAPPAKTTPTRQEVAKSLEQEQKVYLERLQFCTRLRQIAAETGDDKLLEKADFLETQATDVYMRKTAPLKSLVQSVKAAEAHLEERRNNPTPANGTASNGSRSSRSPNGRPMIVRE